jgi:hypothetical protein
MKTSRRNFARALAAGATLASVASVSLGQQSDRLSEATLDVNMKVIDVKTSDVREKQIREALQNTANQVAAIRAYRLKRETPPAVSLGFFDA